MRPIAKLIAAMCLLITGIVVSGAAAAHGSVHFGVVVGGPVWWGGPWYPPYYPYYPPAYFPPAPAVSSPPVYIENGAGAAQPPAAAAEPPASEGANYWYYCRDPEGYYPYVKECNGGNWERVPAEPAK